MRRPRHRRGNRGGEAGEEGHRPGPAVLPEEAGIQKPPATPAKAGVPGNLTNGGRVRGGFEPGVGICPPLATRNHDFVWGDRIGSDRIGSDRIGSDRPDRSPPTPVDRTSTPRAPKSESRIRRSRGGREPTPIAMRGYVPRFQTMERGSGGEVKQGGSNKLDPRWIPAFAGLTSFPPSRPCKIPLRTLATRHAKLGALWCNSMTVKWL